MSDESRVVEQTIRIEARPETVWRYWTDPARMCDWWGVDADLDPRPGGVCRVTVGEGAVMRGDYVELVPYERIVFTFGWEAIHPNAAPMLPGSTRVEVMLLADGEDTVLTLRHTGIPTEDIAEQHDHGWRHFLGALATAAKGDQR